jgi:hypothetical protein
MGIFRVASRGPAGPLRHADDDPGNPHLGESVDIVDQLAADNFHEETFRLCEVTAEKARVGESIETRPRHFFAGRPCR